MENTKETGFYIIKEQFFIDFAYANLKGNKEENRPHYYCYKVDNLLWIIPMTSKYEKKKDVYDKDMARFGRCDKFEFLEFKGKMNALLIQDIFPITEDYIERQYLVNGIAYELKNEELIERIERKAKKVLALARAGKKINPTQPDILRVEADLLARLALGETAATERPDDSN